MPPVGLADGLRAPTSDLNVTIGLALVAFFTFHIEGFRRLGARGYLSKFFPFYQFKQASAGLIAMFVGFTELFLRVHQAGDAVDATLWQYLRGEVALGVVTGLFIAVIPVALYGLEIMLTFVQALIFSTLTLMFVLVAIESHDHEEGHAGEEAIDALEDARRHAPATAH